MTEDAELQKALDTFTTGMIQEWRTGLDEFIAMLRDWPGENDPTQKILDQYTNDMIDGWRDGLKQITYYHFHHALLVGPAPTNRADLLTHVQKSHHRWPNDRGPHDGFPEWPSLSFLQGWHDGDHQHRPISHGHLEGGAA